MISDQVLERKLRMLDSTPVASIDEVYPPVAVRPAPPERPCGPRDLSFLGSGTFGAVHARRRHGAQEVRAVKEVPRRLLHSLQGLRHTLTEVAVLRTLRHESLVAVHEVLHTADHLYLVMDLGRGQELYKVIAQRQPVQRLGVSESQLVTRKLLSALDFIHERDIVHRDVKPENILFDPGSGDTRLIDFGLAKMIRPRAAPAAGGNPARLFPSGPMPHQQRPPGPASSSPPRPDPRPSPAAPSGATPAGHSPGNQLVEVTPGTYSKEYAAMEAVVGMVAAEGRQTWQSTRRTLPKLDIYGAGATLWVMLVGCLPPWYQVCRMALRREQLEAVLQQIRELVAALQFPGHAGHLAEEAPDALQLLKRMMAVDPHARPSAQEAMQDPFLMPGSIRVVAPRQGEIKLQPPPCSGKRRRVGRGCGAARGCPSGRGYGAAPAQPCPLQTPGAHDGHPALEAARAPTGSSGGSGGAGDWDGEAEAAGEQCCHPPPAERSPPHHQQLPGAELRPGQQQQQQQVLHDHFREAVPAASAAAGAGAAAGGPRDAVDDLAQGFAGLMTPFQQQEDPEDSAEP
eukprot:TRINITY_DN3328_c1_g3_i3.p1 TRINITY_DN3328_c1_g3~~TRINITY_DN3328_c1_g3_i3.p1  ORF type:complete len:570 (+),score=180.67 TRINITY_DN3328_c1_g3_i3:77-1786(+)